MYSIRNNRGKFVTRRQYPLVLLHAVWLELCKVRWQKSIALGCMIGLFLGVVLDAYKPFENTIVYEAHAEAKEVVVQVEPVIDWSPERISQEIETQAKKYGVSATLMKKIVQCESMGSTTIQSNHRLSYGREQSFGLAQIHLPDHKNVSKEQALDPKFALEFMAKNIAAGRVGMWSCSRMIK